MIKHLLNLHKGLGSNNVLNVDFGFREIKGVAQWVVNVVSSFVINVEEQDVLMDLVQEEGK